MMESSFNWSGQIWTRNSYPSPAGKYPICKVGYFISPVEFE
jgi:hypothetical protein